MSGLANITRRAFGMSAEGQGEARPGGRKIGPRKVGADGTYYGNIAGEILGQKNGEKK